jgi:hypothetical protein
MLIATYKSTMPGTNHCTTPAAALQSASNDVQTL